jgi:hypothetical protein
MAILDEDNDVSTIAIALVIGAIGVGTLLYAFSHDDTVQTASNFPVIDKTVPTIVPPGPQM